VCICVHPYATRRQNYHEKTTSALVAHESMIRITFHRRWHGDDVCRLAKRVPGRETWGEAIDRERMAFPGGTAAATVKIGRP
jgi:hypothetical protein